MPILMPSLVAAAAAAVALAAAAAAATGRCPCHLWAAVARGAGRFSLPSDVGTTEDSDVFQLYVLRSPCTLLSSTRAMLICEGFTALVFTHHRHLV